MVSGGLARLGEIDDILQGFKKATVHLTIQLIHQWYEPSDFGYSATEIQLLQLKLNEIELRLNGKRNRDMDENKAKSQAHLSPFFRTIIFTIDPEDKYYSKINTYQLVLSKLRDDGWGFQLARGRFIGETVEKMRAKPSFQWGEIIPPPKRWIT